LVKPTKDETIAALVSENETLRKQLDSVLNRTEKNANAYNILVIGDAEQIKVIDRIFSETDDKIRATGVQYTISVSERLVH